MQTGMQKSVLEHSRVKLSHNLLFVKSKQTGNFGEQNLCVEQRWIF